MIFPLLLALQAAAAPVSPPAVPDPAPAGKAAPGVDEGKLAACVDLARRNPKGGEGAATQWHVVGGGFLARQCLGLAYAGQQRWAAAAEAFGDAAREAELAHDARMLDYRAQQGNAWLAAGEPQKARAALDAALASGAMQGLALGEAQLDRARAEVALGDLEGARGDIDRALATAGEDPLAWLLSATLARRMGDLPRAHKDIAEALSRANDDAAVQLEAGNIAALSGDADGARAAWGKVLTLAPGSPRAESARAALAQFGSAEH